MRSQRESPRRSEAVAFPNSTAARASTAVTVVALVVAAILVRADDPSYDQVVLGDQPVAFWDVSAADRTEPDLTGNGNTGTYVNDLPALVSMPNGDSAADFNNPGLSSCTPQDLSQCQYLSVPSNPDGSLSIPATPGGMPAVLTWEAWIAPDVLQFDIVKNGEMRYLGKCERYSPTCEWEARMYNFDAPSRSNRISAYAFNLTDGFGSGAFWQPVDGLFQANQWLHIVAEYTLLNQPAVCQNTTVYPGSIDIWVNGVKWNQARHGQTGCMSQFMVAPQAGNSALNVGTMAGDTFFRGAIAKVAIYKSLLSDDQISNHYTAMTGLIPTGSCFDSCTF